MTDAKNMDCGSVALGAVREALRLMETRRPLSKGEADRVTDVLRTAVTAMESGSVGRDDLPELARQVRRLADEVRGKRDDGYILTGTCLGLRAIADRLDDKASGSRSIDRDLAAQLRAIADGMPEARSSDIKVVRRAAERVFAQTLECRSISEETFYALVSVALDEVYGGDDSAMSEALSMDRVVLNKWRNSRYAPPAAGAKYITRIIIRDAVRKRTEQESVRQRLPHEQAVDDWWIPYTKEQIREYAECVVEALGLPANDGEVAAVMPLLLALGRVRDTEEKSKC